MRRVRRFCWILLCGCLALTCLQAQGKNVTKTVPLDRDGRVVIDTYKGSVTVTSWDDPKVELAARIEPDGPTAARDIENTEIRIDSSAITLRVKSDYARVSRPWFSIFASGQSLPFVHYTIRMPRTARLEIKDFKSDIRVTNLKSEVQIDTYKGNTTVSGLDGGLKFHTYKGDARLHFQRLAASSSFDTYKGEIQIELPRDARFQLDRHIGRHGSLRSDFDQLPAGGPTLNLKTYRGTFKLRKA